MELFENLNKVCTIITCPFNNCGACTSIAMCLFKEDEPLNSTLDDFNGDNTYDTFKSFIR